MNQPNHRKRLAPLDEDQKAAARRRARAWEAKGGSVTFHLNSHNRLMGVTLHPLPKEQ